MKRLFSKNKKAMILTIVLVAAALMASFQAAQATKFLFGSYPTGFWGGGPGNNEGCYFVKIDTNNDGTPDTWYETYCIENDVLINWGTNYDAIISPATDNDIMQSVAYIISWWHKPGTFTGNPGYVAASGFTQANAVSVARAIWHHTDNLALASGTDELKIANDADGKDVIRAGDTFKLTLFSQSATSAQIKAKVDTREGVMVLFKMTGTTGTSLSSITPTQWNLPAEGYTYKGITDVNGEITFTVNFVENSPVPVQINAYSQGIWPNVLNPDQGSTSIQNLAAVAYGTSLTVKRDVLLFSVPEYGLAGLSAIGVCFVAFALFKKRGTKLKATI